MNITLVSLALASLFAVTLIYSLLTAWWKTRTGIGFLSMMTSFTWMMGVMLADILFDISLIWWWVAWALIIITVNAGVLWNLIYKQFIQKHSDYMGRNTARHKEQYIDSDA